MSTSTINLETTTETDGEADVQRKSAASIVPPGSESSILEERIYKVPVRLIKTPVDVHIWTKSKAYYDIIGFINGISVSIQGKRCTDELPLSEVVEGILELFLKLNVLMDETPPVEQPTRFGNKSFRTWFDKFKERAIDYLQAALPKQYHRAVPEIVVYLTESFGNSTRIDYGTGHEFAFIMFLCCLFKIKALDNNDRAATGVKIFNAYLIFVRRLQKTYRMEPAGSHGVWSLDDYQFIPFIWGSAQLAVNAPIEPENYLDSNIVEMYKEQYMFISCIDYIKEVKSGHFAEHSNQLWSISAVQSWIKINSGLVKMYQNEVLSKFPLIQHVLFGSLMVLDPVPPGTILSQPRLGMLPPGPHVGLSVRSSLTS